MYLNALNGNSRNNVILKTYICIECKKNGQRPLGIMRRKKYRPLQVTEKIILRISLFPEAVQAVEAAISMKQDYIVKPEEILRMDSE